VPVKAPHYHLMGGRARHADPTTARQALLPPSQPKRAPLRPSQLRDERPLSARPDAIRWTARAEEAR
jgi:hypothetical protein